MVVTCGVILIRGGPLQTSAETNYFNIHPLLPINPPPSHPIQVNRAEYLVTGDRNVVTRQWFASAAKLELAEKHSSPVSALLVFCHSPLSCFVFCHSPLSAQFVFCVFSLSLARAALLQEIWSLSYLDHCKLRSQRGVTRFIRLQNCPKLLQEKNVEDKVHLRSLL